MIVVIYALSKILILSSCGCSAVILWPIYHQLASGHQQRILFLVLVLCYSLSTFQGESIPCIAMQLFWNLKGVKDNRFIKGFYFRWYVLCFGTTFNGFNTFHITPGHILVDMLPPVFY